MNPVGGMMCVAFLGLAALCGCTGGGGGQWAKRGADSAATAREYEDCVGLAKTATQKDAEIDQDIAATRSADLQHSMVVQARTAQMRDKTRRSTEAIVAGCMRQKGFYQRRQRTFFLLR